MQKYRIDTQIDWVGEAIELLRKIASEDGYEELKKSLKKKYQFSDRALTAKFSLVQKIEKRARKELKDRSEDIRFYFGRQEEGQFELGQLAILWTEMMWEQPRNVADLREKLEAISEEAYVKLFAEILEGENGLIREKQLQSKIETKIDVIGLLMNLEIDDRQKWKIQKIFLDPQPHREKVYDLLERAIKVLKRYESAILEATERFGAYWTQKYEKIAPIEYIKNQIGITLDQNALEMRIVPGIISLNSLSIRMKEEGTSYYVRLGIMFDEEFTFDLHEKKNRDQTDYVVRVLKVLSDRSKFEILSYLKEHKAYGSELAKHMDLTTATISHHMSALLQLGLVEMEKKDTKIYYRSNQKVIEDILNYSREKLL